MPEKREKLATQNGIAPSRVEGEQVEPQRGAMRPIAAAGRQRLLSNDGLI